MLAIFDLNHFKKLIDARDFDQINEQITNLRSIVTRNNNTDFNAMHKVKLVELSGLSSKIQQPNDKLLIRAISSLTETSIIRVMAFSELESQILMLINKIEILQYNLEKLIVSEKELKLLKENYDSLLLRLKIINIDIGIYKKLIQYYKSTLDLKDNNNKIEKYNSKLQNEFATKVLIENELFDLENKNKTITTRITIEDLTKNIEEQVIELNHKNDSFEKAKLEYNNAYQYCSELIEKYTSIIGQATVSLKRVVSRLYSLNPLSREIFSLSKTYQKRELDDGDFVDMGSEDFDNEPLELALERSNAGSDSSFCII